LQLVLAVAFFALVVALIATLPFAGQASAQIRVEDDFARVVPLGLSKVWALRRSITIPLSSIAAVRTEAAPRRIRAGWRIAGTAIPGLAYAGYFRERGVRSFLVVGRRRPLVLVECRGARFDRVLFSCDDPEETARQLSGALPSAG
jgi:hypothetical protein